MSRINLSENLFIGVQELQTMQTFLSSFNTKLGLMTKNFGFIENKDAYNLSQVANSDRICFKASSPGNLQLQFASPSYAFAYPNNMITWDRSQTLILPDSYKGKTYWVKISYQETYLEVGTLTIDSSGNVSGTGTS